jgi:OmpA-OmpF porin, OOP family
MSEFRKDARAPRRLAAQLVLATTLVAAISCARAADDRVGFLVTSDGAPVTSGAGCVHTREWRPGMHYEQCNPAPAKVAQAAPAVAKPAAPNAPKPAPEKFVAVPFELSIDTLFGFNEAVLSPEGNSLLDRIADRIGRAEYRNVDIVGHADRIGTVEYNQRLSERRAQAVRDYLVERGIDARRLSAEGAGSSRPVTAPDQCRNMNRERLIQCLQPDRYAELKIDGTAPNAAVSRDILGLEPARTAALTAR